VTTQGTLFDRAHLVPAPRARRSGGATAAAAATDAKGLARVHARLVLAALRHGPATAEEIAERRLGGALTCLQVMKRTSELLRAGMVEVHDENGTTHSGRRCRRYRLAKPPEAPQ